MRKKKNNVSGGGEDGWLMTYGDTITLLMAFFVMLLSVSSIDQAKVEAMQSGFDEVFSKTESDQPFASLKEKLNEIVEERQLQDKISITPDPLGVHLRFSSQLLFKSGEATIKSQMYPILRNVVDAIKESEYQDYIVKVEGHTDNIPIRTDQYESNWELSAHRATKVVRFFVKEGIPKKRVWAIALADSTPLVPNMKTNGLPNPENQSKNRRIEVYIHRNFK